MTLAAAPVIVYVGLGSNLEHPHLQLAQAFDALARLPGTGLVARSSLYRSAPVGKADQPDFINGVAKLKTALDAQSLLEALLTLEAKQGRVRSVPNAARTLDLDLLLYGDCVIRSPNLEVPHPRMHERAFVLIPLSEIDPDVMIPGKGRASMLLRHVADQDVTLFHAP